MERKNPVLTRTEEMVIEGLAPIDEAIFWRFGKPLSESVRLRIQDDNVGSIIDRNGSKYFKITPQQPLDLVLSPDEEGIAVMCVEPAASYGQSTHPQRSEFHDIYRFAPAGRDGILFNGRLVPDQTGGMSFSLAASEFVKPDPKIQFSNAKKHLRQLREHILNADLIRN